MFWYKDDATIIPIHGRVQVQVHGTTNITLLCEAVTDSTAEMVALLGYTDDAMPGG